MNKIEYKLMQKSEYNSEFCLINTFGSRNEAKEYINKLQPTEDEYYRIDEVHTKIEEGLKFCVPAYSPTLAEIAHEIATDSNGSFYIEWGDKIEKLSAEDQEAVQNMVYEQVGPCDCCGWHWAYDDMEQINGETMCYKCAEEHLEDEEEEDDWERDND